MGGIKFAVFGKVSDLLERIVQYGVTSDLTLQQKKLVIITNKFALFTDFVVFSSIFLDYYHGFYSICLLKALLVPIVLLSIFFNHRKYKFVGKTMLVFIANAIVFVLDNYFGKDSGVYNYYLMNLAGISFLYSKNEKWNLAFYYLFTASLMGISIAADHRLFLNTHIPQPVLDELYTNNFIYMSLTLVYYAYTVVDINDKYETQLLKQQQKLQEGEDKLKETLRMKDSILEIMAHDLRNPLNTILGSNDLLKMKIKMQIKQSEEDILKNVLRVEQAVTHSTNIINNLLQLHEFEQVSKTVNKQNICLSEIVNEVLENIKPFIEAKNIRMVVNVADIAVEVNPTRFERALENLIINAIKFSKPGSEVLVKGCLEKTDNEAGEYVLISIRDNGIGIPTDYKEHLFDVFTIAKRVGTNGEQSTGMGLSITKKLVEMNGGKLSYQSEEGEGTTFFISLPRPTTTT